MEEIQKGGATPAIATFHGLFIFANQFIHVAQAKKVHPGVEQPPKQL